MSSGRSIAWVVGWVAAFVGVPAAAQSSTAATVWTPLSESARSQLAAWLDTAAPGRFVVETGPTADRVQGLLTEHPEVGVLFGYAQVDLERLAKSSRFPAFLENSAVAAQGLDDRETGVRALFADPVVLAVDLSRMTHSFGSKYADVLPTSLLDLAGSEFEGRFLIEAGSADSVLGAILGRVAIARGTAAETWMEGFGKNTAGALALTSSEALVRLDRNEDKRFAVARRSVVEREGKDLGVVVAGDVSADVTCVFLGFACVRDDAASAAFLAALANDLASGASALVRIAKAEGVVPLRGPLPADASDSWRDCRRLVEFETPRLRAEISAIEESLDHFENHAKDAIAKRQQRFEDVYDVAGLLVIAIVFGTFLLRRKPNDSLSSAS